MHRERHRPAAAAGLAAGLVAGLAAVLVAACGGQPATPTEPSGPRSPSTTGGVPSASIAARTTPGTAAPPPSPGASGPATACAPLPPDMQGWWPGDDTADEVLGGRDGTVVDAVAYASGSVGRGFAFDGAGFVRVPHDAVLSPSASFSWLMWIKPAGSEPGSLVQKWGDEGDLANRRQYSLMTQAAGVLSFAISDDANQANTTLHGFASPEGVAPVGAWTHVAFVYDQATGTRAIYANGVPVAHRTDPPITLTNAPMDLAFGALIRSSTTTAFFYRGLLDEVQYVTRAVSEAEIDAIVEAGAAGVCRPA